MTQPRILALETTGAYGSVAAGTGDTFLDEESLSTSARHAADLLPAIDRLCRKSGWSPGDVSAQESGVARRSHRESQ